MIALVRAFIRCVRLGGHDFRAGAVCLRCGAKQGGRTIGALVLDATRDARDTRTAHRAAKGRPS